MENEIGSRVVIGDARVVLRDPNKLGAGQPIQTVVTSPPYYKMREYGGGVSQTGQEPTPVNYLTGLADTFSSLWNHLHPTATVWVNIGDTYLNRELAGIPWAFARKMSRIGYKLQQEIIWSKPNPNRGGGGNRCTLAHEHVFLFSRDDDYYFDKYAILEKGKTVPLRQCGTVWEIPTQSSKLAHFAMMPEKLAERCVEAGSPRLCCGNCHFPFQRVVQRRRVPTRPGTNTKVTGNSKREGKRDPQRHVTFYTLLDWEPGCKCGFDYAPVPSMVCDPFAGLGTTGVVATRNGRSFTGIELNPAYAVEAGRRIKREGIECFFRKRK